MPSQPTASIVIPTRGRPGYLDVALRSITPQATAAGAEVIVINDGDDAATREVCRRHNVRGVAVDPPRGANAGRNTGIAAATADLVVLTDDDVEAPDGWLAAILKGAGAAPDVGVFGGPIRARLEGGGPRACGREGAPITTLDLGPVDRNVPLVWSANMALRREAVERAGPFDESIVGRGEEEDWERRYAATGGVIRYLADAGLDHRRTAADATLRRLVPAAYAQGRAARRYDVRKGVAPSLAGELRTLSGSAWHIVRRRCAIGFVLLAQAAGRTRELLAPGMTRTASAPTDDFLSGVSGEVSGIRATARAVAYDAVCDGAALLTLAPWRLHRAVRTVPRRSVLALGIERRDVPNVLSQARQELERSRHRVQFVATEAGARGKFENLNELLAAQPASGHDWLLLIDDDVSLPRDFLDTFIVLAERFDLALAQPAHRWRSHAGWRVTRRRPGVVARETRFVEIGPVCALRADTFATLLPFPALRFGWGLDLHWSALAQARGWRQGVIDATPVRHGLRRIASSYDRSDAVAETRQFLADRPYTPASAAQRTVAVHRRW